MPLHQGRDIAVFRAGQKISFPMAENRSIFRFCRSFADGNRIDDLPPGVSMLARIGASGACVSSTAGGPSALFSTLHALE